MKVFIRYKKPKINYVKIDPQDTWSMDNTLALIILPMLKQLKNTKHSSGMVDDKDVPKHLRSTAAPPKKNEWDVDDNVHKRWDYVLDEMIWAFEQLQDFDHDRIFFEGDEFDRKGYEAHNKRIQNATILFGKYYRSLWD